MITRNYHIQVKLEIHAITCPGVCLCPNGGVNLTIRTLGYFLTTNQAPPRFPIIYHDTFHLEGFFKTVNSLAQLEDSLRNEKVDIAMWQNSRRLAHCCKTLYSFLLDQPFKVTSQNYNKLLDMDGNLLMTPSSCFPGIIGPRVEYTSRVKLLQPEYDLSEAEDGRKEHCCYRGGRINCESPASKEMVNLKNVKHKEFRRQRPVCHYSENAQAECDKRYHSDKQHRNFTHKNFETKKFHCDCVRDFDESSSVNIMVENHSHQQYQYPQQTMAPIPPRSTSTKTLKNYENFNELKTVTNPAQKIECHCTSSWPQESKSVQQRYSQNMQRNISNSSPSYTMADLDSPGCQTCPYLKEMHDKCRRYLDETDYAHSSSLCATCIKYRRTFNLK